MKFTHLNGHNPNSPSAKARAEKMAAITRGVVKCKKCGASRATLYKVNEDPAEYICADCRKS